MELNAKKTKDMWITFKKSCPTAPPISIGPSELERVSEFKLLGVYVQNDLKWNTHFSDSLIIHKPKTKEITTVKEVWICGLN